MKVNRGRMMIVVLLALFLLCCGNIDDTLATRQPDKVKLGVEVFLEKHLP